MTRLRLMDEKLRGSEDPANVKVSTNWPERQMYSISSGDVKQIYFTSTALCYYKSDQHMAMKMATSGSNSSNMSTAKSNDQEQTLCRSLELSFNRFQRDQSPVSQLGCSQSCCFSNLGRSCFYTADNKSSNNTSSSSVPTAVTCSISRPQVDLDACNLFSCNFQQSRSRNCESLVYDHSENQQCLALQSPDDLQYLVNFHIYNKRNDQSYQLPLPQNCTKPAVLSSGHQHSKKYLKSKENQRTILTQCQSMTSIQPCRCS
ncbi:uncharacterized protein LOC115753037 isoform X2 [Rhodamnia argentea]|uniref:Uncharacterized protein LOC115753037 isoform X2 n=1 Tax=Rhodamnia argentea TaxID=178133 RepID=A0ABM3HE82_9MYRT|nr:uncharacterized protein LOC115753037 isoform X2 [Rhodamnia argentea]